MDVQDTIHWVNAPVEQAPIAPPVPEPAAAPRRRWLWPAAVAGGVTLAALGGLTGFVVGDDSDAVQKLEEAAVDSEDEIDDLEARLVDADEAQADLQNDLQLCIDASTSTQSLLTAVDDMSNAYEEFLATPIGSSEETDAGIAMTDAYYDVVGTTRAVELDTEDCLATKP